MSALRMIIRVSVERSNQLKSARIFQREVLVELAAIGPQASDALRTQRALHIRHNNCPLFLAATTGEAQGSQGLEHLGVSPGKPDRRRSVNGGSDVSDVRQACGTGMIGPG